MLRGKISKARTGIDRVAGVLMWFGSDSWKMYLWIGRWPLVQRPVIHRPSQRYSWIEARPVFLSYRQIRSAVSLLFPSFPRSRIAIFPVESSKTTGAEASGEGMPDCPMHVPLTLANNLSQAAPLDAWLI